MIIKRLCWLSKEMKSYLFIIIIIIIIIINIIIIIIIILIAHNVTEVAHNCVVALKNWFEGRGIKNSFDTWHGKFQMFQMFLDFEKPFDTIEWPFIRKTFQHFGFGSSILKWLNLFYCCPESCVLNNGWASDFFEIQKGVRQGCPLSPYLFVLAVEVLAKAIRENKSIKEIFVNGKEIKLSQYADDTTLILDGTKEWLIASLKTLDDFYEVSGLKLNDKKTEAFWIGANCNKDKISILGRNLNELRGNQTF